MYIAIDLGGTNTRVASSKDLKNIHKVEKFDTKNSLEQQRHAITQAINNVAEENITVICIGVPGLINKKENRFGHIVNFPHLSNKEYHELFDFELFKPKKDFCSFIAENDAALAGLGEAVFGAGKKYETIAYITISTAVGGVRVSNKKLDLTQKYSEPGHHIIEVGGPKDTKVSLQGTLEAYVSGTAFERNYGESPITCENQEIWDDYGKRLANGMINVCAFWAPDIIVLGGGVSNKFNLFYKSLVTNFGKQDFFAIPVFKKSELEDDAGLFGGFAFIDQQENQN